MAVYLTNSFEEGSNGTTITTGNSAPPAGAGNAFDTVTIGASATLTYDNTQAAHGTLSAKYVEPASAVSIVTEWSTSLTATSLLQAWFRAYIFITAFPTANLRIIRGLNGATFCCAIAISNAGKVLTLNSAGATQTTSTTVVPTSAWFRLEGFFIGSPTAGQIQVKIFTTSDDEISPDETNTTGAAINTTNTLTKISFGQPSSVASYTLWLDDLGASDTGYLGPSQFTGTGTAALTLAATSTGSSRRSGSSTGAVTVAATSTGSVGPTPAAAGGNPTGIVAILAGFSP